MASTYSIYNILVENSLTFAKGTTGGYVVAVNSNGSTYFVPLPSTSSDFIQGGNSFGTAATIGTLDNNNVRLISKGNLGLIIFTNSNVAIGTSTDNGYKLYVNGSASITDLYSNNISTNNVNINGTASISGNLYVNKGVVFASTYSGVYSDGIVVDYVNGNGRISVGASDSITFYTNGIGVTAIATLQANGNIGIGTTSTAYKFHIIGTATSGPLNVNNNLVINSSGGVGIGTASPSSLLDLVGTGPQLTIGAALNGAGYIAFRRQEGSPVHTYGFASNTETYEIRSYHSGDGGYYTWYTNNSINLVERFRIANSGNVSIGTNSTTYLLHLSGTATSGTLNVNNNLVVDYNGNIGIGIVQPVTKFHIYSGNSSYQFLNERNSSSDAAISVKNSSSQWVFGIDGTYDVFSIANGGAIGGNQKLSISNSGNIGIGRTTPSAKLHIYGTYSSDLFRVDLGTISTLFYIGTAGNVGIGTTASLAILDVRGSRTATNSIARGIYTAASFSAIANNDILVGLDVASTYNIGTFSGVRRYAARFTTPAVAAIAVSSNQAYIGENADVSWTARINTQTFETYNNNMSLNASGATNHSILFKTTTNANSVQTMQLYNTGNLVLQNGGVFADNGYRLQVNGLTGSTAGAAYIIGLSNSTLLRIDNDTTTNVFNITGVGDLTNTGNIYSGGHVRANTGYSLYWYTRSIMRSPIDGYITLYNNGTTDFGLLQFGGTSSSFAALKRSSTNLQARLADDSGYAGFDASFYMMYGSTALNASGASLQLAASGTYTNLNILKKTLINLNPVSNTSGSLNIGSASFDGVTTGFFTGSNAGTSIAVNEASGYTGNFIDLQIAGTSKFYIDYTGRVSSAGSFLSIGNLQAGSGQIIYFANRTKLTSPSDGNLLIQNFAQTDFNLLQFGGTSSSFPALKRSTTTLQARLADDSGYVSLDASFYLISGNTALNTSGASLQLAASGAYTNLNILKKTLINLNPLSVGTGALNVGAAAFDGITTGFFTGSNAGTSIAINEVSGYTGSFIDAQLAGVSKFKVDYTGGITTPNLTINSAGNISGSSFLGSGVVRVGTTNYFEFSTRSRLYSPSDGTIRLTNNASTDFSLLQFGGTSSSFPALKRTGSILSVRLADDTAYTGLSASTIYSSLVQSTTVQTNQLGVTGSVVISGTSSASTLISIEGVSGQLFSVIDSMTGSIFNVNDMSGVPVLTVDSSYTTTNKSLFKTTTLNIQGLTGGGNNRNLIIDNNGLVSATVSTAASNNLAIAYAIALG